MYSTIKVEASLLGKNQETAQALQAEWTAARMLAVNVLSSPGAGKTTLLETVVPRLSRPSLVIEGDLATERDAQRLRAAGVDAIQITTGGTCHLEARMVEAAWRQQTERRDGFLIIENVGNLVCPASYALGEHLRIVLLSVTEGDDKPQKYPKAFHTANVLVITKVDLLPYVPFNIENAIADAHEINPKLRIFVVSARTGDGLPVLIQFLEETWLARFESPQGSHHYRTSQQIDAATGPLGVRPPSPPR